MFDMHDSLMSQIGMEQEQHHHSGESYGNDGWADINSYNPSQHQSPIHEYGSYGFMNHVTHGLPSESTFTRMAPPPLHATHQQQLLPLIMPSHPTWPSMLTNPAGYQTHIPTQLPPVTLPTKPAKLSTSHAPSPRKTLTDEDRRRMCRYHEENPTVKQTEIGGEQQCPRYKVRSIAHRVRNSNVWR